MLKMLKQRNEESENNFKQRVEEMPNSNFKTMLLKDMKYYLLENIDKLYHRNILISNVVEILFRSLKR